MSFTHKLAKFVTILHELYLLFNRTNIYKSAKNKQLTTKEP